MCCGMQDVDVALTATGQPRHPLYGVVTLDKRVTLVSNAAMGNWSTVFREMGDTSRYTRQPSR
jgi:hypothetical protein